MSNTKQRKITGLRRTFCLAACFLIFSTLKATGAPPCEREVCIRLEHQSGKAKFSIPPTKILYVLELPEKTGLPKKVYVYLMRANAAGQFEIASEAQSNTMPGIQMHPTWDPSKTPRNRKSSDRFVLAATLDPYDRNPREVTRDFGIKRGEH